MIPTVDIVIPVLNEEYALPSCIASLCEFLSEHSPYPARIIIADNGSTDKTPDLAKRLSDENPQVDWIRIETRGRGRALRKVWLESNADIVAYMDVDLSTDLKAFPPLVRAVGEEGYDLAVGSRLMKGSIVDKRSLKREITSRAYNMIIKAMFFTGFSDAQCGFKAIRKKIADILVPVIEDNGWFFDSELLILAEKAGFNIKDIPVNWIDDPDTRVNIIRTAMDDLSGLSRLRFGGLSSALRAMSL